MNDEDNNGTAAGGAAALQAPAAVKPVVPPAAAPSAPPAPVAAAPKIEEPSIFEMFDTDATVETKGVLINYGSKIRVLVARAGGANKAFERILNQLTKPHRRVLRNVQNGSASDLEIQLMDGILKEAYAKSVVLGWDGIQLEKNGPFVECNVKNCIAVFDRLPLLWADIQRFAGDPSNFRVEDTEDVVKN